MKFTRWFAICVVIVLGVTVLGTTAGAQSGGDEEPKATDVGITDKEIHVAVIADVDSPLAPNLFKAAVDGMQGWAKYTNSKAGGGGLAGRKVVIDFLDSKLNPAETKNAQITACQNDGCRGRYLGGVPDLGRRDAQLQGLDRRGHRPARHPVRVDGAGAAVFGPVVPDRAAAGAL